MFTICYDTMCDGFTPIMDYDENDNATPCSYATEAEAQAEIDNDPEFYEDCFVCAMDQIGHKTIYTGKEE